jgi:hypothetical protein
MIRSKGILIILITAFSFLNFFTKEVTAAERWKIMEIISRKPLKLTGDDWLFKAKIKNIGETRSKGERLSLTIKVYGGSTLIETKTINISPGLIYSGESGEFDFEIAGHETGLTYQKITVEIQSSDTEGFSETFNIQSR